MTWLEYELAVNAYFTRNARQWEPSREFQTMIYNMFAEKADKLDSPRELIWLYTDEYSDEELAENDSKESEDDFFKRMFANNFYQSPTPKAEKIMSE